MPRSGSETAAAKSDRADSGDRICRDERIRLVLRQRRDYNITHPERAGDILERKLKNIALTEADVVLTGNPGCLLQLNAGVKKAGIATQVLHPTQLLDAAYRSDTTFVKRRDTGEEKT